jgi:hypothetical protein
MNPEERVERLEQELVRTRSRNRWLIAALLLVSAGAIAGLGRQPKVPEGVRAKSFGLVDRVGKVRASLEVNDENCTRFSLSDESMLPRFMMMVGADKTHLAMPDKNGKTVMNMMVNDDGEPNLWMADKYGKTRLMMYLSEDKPRLVTQDENANVTWKAP